MLKTLKRKIALVAVAGLGFGVISTVPAFAAAVNLGAQGTINIADAAVRTGQSQAVVFSGDLDAFAAAADVATFTVALATKPTASVATLANNVSISLTDLANMTEANAAGTVTFTATAATDPAAGALITATITPDVAGTYTLTFTDNVGTRTFTLNAYDQFTPSVTAYRASSAAATNFLVDPANTNATNGLAKINARITAVPAGATANTVEVGDIFSTADESMTLGTAKQISIGRANALADVANAATAGGALTATANGTARAQAVVQLPTVANGVNVGDSVSGAVDLNGDLDYFDAGEGLGTPSTDYLNVAGSYGVFIWVDSDADNLWDSNEAFLSTSILVGGTPTTFAIALGSTTAAPAGTTDVNVTVRDANGNPTLLTGAEQIDLRATTVSGAATYTWAGDGSQLTNGDAIETDAVYYTSTVAASAAGSFSVSGNFSGSIAPLAAAISGGTVTVTTITAATGVAVKAGQVVTATADTTHSYPAALSATSATGAFVANPLTAKAITYVITGTAGSYAQITIAAAGAGLPTGVTAKTDAVLVPASGSLEYTVTTTDTAAATKGYTLTVEAGAADFVYTAIYNAATVNGTTITTDKISTVLTRLNTAVAGKSTFVVTVKDEYNVAYSNYTVTLTTTAGSRNASKTVTAITGADGTATLELTDASTSTTNLADIASIAVYAPGTALDLEDTGDSVTIVYGVTLASLTITGGSTAAAEVSVNTIYDATPTTGEAQNVALTFTLKDSTGATVTGYGVTVTGSEGVLIGTADNTAIASLKATQTVANNATAFAYCTKIGTGKITATSGGVTGTAEITCKLSATTVARSVELTAGDNSATVTVKDGHGNGVAGFTVALSLTGDGGFGNGQSSTTVVTGVGGVATVNITSTKTGTANLVATITGAEQAQAAGTPVSTFAKGVASATAAVKVTAATAAVNPATDSAINAVKTDVKAVSDTVATLSKAVTTVQSSVTELTSSFATQIKSLTDAIAKISRAIAALQKSLKKK